MPDVAVLIAWFLVGWFCGTPPILPPRPILPPNPIVPPDPIHPPNPSLPPSPIRPPHPEPDPWPGYVIAGVLAAVGGLAGGFVFAQLFGADYADRALVVVTLAGAFVGARLLADLRGLLLPEGRGAGS